VLANIAAHWSPRTGFTSLIRFGDEFDGRRLPAIAALPLAIVPGAGYDGQYYAQLAIEPNVTSPDVHRAIDITAYRARRILLPLIAHIFGFGSPWWTLQVYALLNTVAWLLLAWCWWRWLPNHDARGTVVWILCVLSLGALDSVRFSLSDLPMLLCLVAAVRAVECQRPRWAAVAFLAAGFIRETAILAIRPFALSPTERDATATSHQQQHGEPTPKRHGSMIQSLRRNHVVAGHTHDHGWFGFVRTWSLPVLLCVAPVALWSLALLRLAPGPMIGFSGNFDWPGFALARHVATCVREIAHGNWDSRYLFGLIGAAGLAYQSIYLLLHWRDADPWLRLGLPFAVLFWFLGDFVWHGYWAVARTTLPMTFAFNRALLRDQRACTHLISGNLFVLHSVYRFVGI
jgi:hypothetical protein